MMDATRSFATHAMEVAMTVSMIDNVKPVMVLVASKHASVANS